MAEMGSWVTDSLPKFAKNLHVLLIDHDLVSLNHLASLLQQQSFNVTTTQLASVALSMIRGKGHRFDLVMANVIMPDMDSFSFLHVLLKQHIAIILMSSGANLSVATKALAEGACYLLQKPVSKEDLKYVWQHVYQKNRNIIKQTRVASCIEKSKWGKEYVGSEIADTIILSRRATTDNVNHCIYCQPMINTKIARNKEVEFHDTLAGSNFRGKRSIDDMEGINKGKRVKYNSDAAKFGFTRIDEEREKRKEYYITSDSRLRVVWNAERRRKFTDAINKLGDKTRPKLILKMMNEPCLTLRQVANHLQKYKTRVECIKKKRGNKSSSRQETKSNLLPRIQFPSLLEKHHQEMSKFGNGALSSAMGSDRFRLIAPKTLYNSKLPVSDFVNHGLRMLNHNFQHVGLSYNSVSLNINKEAGFCPDNIYSDIVAKSAFGGDIQTSEFNLLNVLETNPEAASPNIFDDTQFPGDLLDIVQRLDLTAFEIENQEATQHSGTENMIQSMLSEINVPDSTYSHSVGTDLTDGCNGSSSITRQEIHPDSANEGSRLLAEFEDILHVLDDDPHNLDSDLNLSDVDKYSEWLRRTVLENRNGPDSFISAEGENSPIESTK